MNYYIVIEIYMKNGKTKRIKLGKRKELMCRNCGHTFKKHRLNNPLIGCTVKGCKCKEFSDV